MHHVADGELDDLAGLGARNVLDLDDEGLLERFARLYDWHIAAEDELVFPAAAQALDEASLAAIAEDMARRRGAR